MEERIRIYFNDSCSKCNAAFCALEEAQIDFETIHYLHQVPDENTFRKLLIKLGIPAVDLIRKSEPIFIKKYANKELSEREAILAMMENPILIQRPIVEFADTAFIVRPPLTIEALLHKKAIE